MSDERLPPDTEWISPGYLGRFYRRDLVLTLVRADPDDLDALADWLTSDAARWRPAATGGPGPLDRDHLPARHVGEPTTTANGASMRFFVPGATDEADAERLYRELAQRAGAEAEPDPGRRVYSISYTASRRQQWTATVGQQLHGEEIREGRSRGKSVTRRKPVREATTVLAIFAGNPYRVVTDSTPRMWGDQWSNPFLVGQQALKDVTLFD
jgi:hypothetical protein